MEGPRKLMGKRAMHKKVRQKYDIWLGEIKCNVKCEMSFDVANRHLFRMGGYQGQNSVFLFCCAILLFCYHVLSIRFNILSFCYWGIQCPIMQFCCVVVLVLPFYTLLYYSVLPFCLTIFLIATYLWLWHDKSGVGKTGKRNRELGTGTGTEIGKGIGKGPDINGIYYSFKIFPRFWLAKSTRLIYHNQFLMTKFGRILT